MTIEPTLDQEQKFSAAIKSQTLIDIQLDEAEALDLASHLRKKLKAGLSIESDPKSIATMVAGLGDPRGLLRLRFANSLSSIGRAAVPALCQAMLTSNQVTVRRAAAKTLTLIADPVSLPDLVNAFLSDNDSVVQGSAMGAIASTGADGVTAILSVLDNPDSSEMQLGLASWALAFISDYVPGALRQAAHSENIYVRKVAISALGSQIELLDEIQVRELLTDAMSDSCAEIRAETATLLGNLEEVNWAETLLIPALSDPDDWVRKNSALALIKLEAVDSISSLKKQIKSEKDQVLLNVMTLAINQLEKIGQV
ncbi:HEAT repeat domain-containing protein [Synechococcus sp. M16CYN]|uniref:HEAT repeat domain-containing protein n=1 Tax=Synechococcus sp. M16CYN TaxID=3103139 RepID=UPI0033421A80